MVQHRHGITQLGDLCLERWWVTGDATGCPDLEEDRVDVVTVVQVEGDARSLILISVQVRLGPSKDVYGLRWIFSHGGRGFTDLSHRASESVPAYIYPFFSA